MLCEQIPEVEVVKAFNNPDTFIQEFPELEFDLCISDIEMPQMNGLEVAKLLNGKPVIFVTAYQDYAVDAFDIDALDFVSKPIKLERLQKAILKAIKYLATPTLHKNFIHLNTDKGKSLIYFDQIAYIKSSDIDSRDKYLFFKDGAKVCLKNISFDNLQNLLPQQRFCRINKQEIISLDAVQFYSFDQITLNLLNEQNKPLVLTLSEIYRSRFLDLIKI
jgi:DNA-binding LytR/AlgR family response regulator